MSFDKRPLLRQTLQNQYPAFFLASFCKLLEAGFELLVPLVLAFMLESGIAASNEQALWLSGGLMLLLALFGFIAAAACQILAARVAGTVGKRLRTRLFSHFIQQRNSLDSGQMLQHISLDTAQVEEGVNLFMRLGTRVPFLLVGSVILSFLQHAYAGLLLLIVALILCAVLYGIARASRVRFQTIARHQGNIAGQGAELVAGQTTLRAYHAEKREATAFSRLATQVMEKTIRAGQIAAGAGPISSFLIYTSVALTVLFGGRLIDADTLQTGQLVALISYLLMLLQALLTGSFLLVIFARSMASMKRLESALMQDGSDDYFSVDLPKNIQPTQKFIGITGTLASGKSTLARQMTRGRTVALVPQSIDLVSGTVRENLQMGNPQATDQQMWDALDIAQIADFFRAHQHGLDAPLTTGGKNLSGGQRQRVAIARAILHSGEILLLDDALSALDEDTSQQLLGALLQTQHHRTILLVSPQVRHLRSADHILVMDDKKVVAKGCHNTLAKTSSLYQAICQSQDIDLGGAT